MELGLSLGACHQFFNVNPELTNQTPPVESSFGVYCIFDHGHHRFD